LDRRRDPLVLVCSGHGHQLAQFTDISSDLSYKGNVAINDLRTNI